MATLALDVGARRIGVAISRSGIIAEPLPTIHREGRRQTLDAIQEIVTAEGVGVCIVGLPLLEGGAEGAQAQETRAFARSLQRRLPRLVIHLRDERYTTDEARSLDPGAAGGASGRLDQLAAAIILTEYLNDLSKGLPA